MSDLRDRLERRSERFELEPGALQRTFDRGMRVQRRRRIEAGLVALVVGMLGLFVAISTFGNGAHVPVDRPSPSVVTIPSIPEGSYWTQPFTRAQVLASIKAAGFSRRAAERYYFRALTIPFAGRIQQGLVIQDGFWFQTARNAFGDEEAGWGGNYIVTGPHTVQASNNVCMITYRFSVSGDKLTLRVLHETGPRSMCGDGDAIAQTAIFDSGPFYRET